MSDRRHDGAAPPPSEGGYPRTQAAPDRHGTDPNGTDPTQTEQTRTDPTRTEPHNPDPYSGGQQPNGQWSASGQPPPSSQQAPPPAAPPPAAPPGGPAPGSPTPPNHGNPPPPNYAAPSAPPASPPAPGAPPPGSPYGQDPSQPPPGGQPTSRPLFRPETGEPRGRRPGEEPDPDRTAAMPRTGAATSTTEDRFIHSGEHPVTDPGPLPGRREQSEGTRGQTTRVRGRTRRAQLRLVRIDPWSVMKTAFLLSIAFGIMCVVAVFIVWSVLSAADVWGSINTAVESVVDEDFAIEDYIGMNRVLSFTMLVAVLDVVLITAVATLGAFLYNLAASLLGGLEVTLAEDRN